MKKRLLGLTSSAFIFAAAITGCTVKSGDSSFSFSVSKGDKSHDNKSDTSAKPDINDFKGTYKCNGYASWSLKNYPDLSELKSSLETNPMTVSDKGTMHLNGKDYKLIPEGTSGEAIIFSIDGSGFDLDKFPDRGFMDEKYDGAVYFAKETEHMKVNGTDVPYDTYKVYLTANGDSSCAAYLSFDKE